MTKGLTARARAKDTLDDCNALDPWEELAYRRICDLVLATGGPLKDDDRKLAWMTKTGRRWQAIKQALLDAGKIEISGGFVAQKVDSLTGSYESQNAKPKALKQNDTTHRERAKKGQNDYISLKTHESSLFLDQEKEESERDPPEVEKAVAYWNESAIRIGLTRVQKLTPARKQKLAARLRDNGLDEWRRAVDKLGASRFCTGKNDKNWRADFDFLTSPEKFIRVLEGKYDDPSDRPPELTVEQRMKLPGWDPRKIFPPDAIH
jgi:hypothetical protein